MLFQVSVLGSYTPPVSSCVAPAPDLPPHTIIFDPVQTATCCVLAWGAFVADIGVQVFDEGSKEPPSPKYVDGLDDPPQTSIREPVQTAEWWFLPAGAFEVLVETHELFPGSYMPPVFIPEPPALEIPPQTIISEPVQMAEWVLRFPDPAATGAQVFATGSYIPPSFSME
jgi:hypothetical protein